MNLGLRIFCYEYLIFQLYIEKKEHWIGALSHHNFRHTHIIIGKHMLRYEYSIFQSYAEKKDPCIGALNHHNFRHIYIIIGN